MKKTANNILWLLIAISFKLQADVVTVTGYGESYIEALTNAKITALEMVAGTFIVSSRSWKSEDVLLEEIKQYNGGVIKSYQIVKSSNKEVTIEADVEVNKDNRVISQNATVNETTKNELNSKINDYKAKKVIMDELDDPSKAFAIKTLQTQFNPENDFIIIKMDNRLIWQPKWVSDLKSFALLTGKNKELHTDATQQISSNILNSVMAMHPLAAVAGSFVHQEINKPISNKTEPLLCFANKTGQLSDNCYEMAIGFNKMPIYLDMRIEISALDKNGKLLYRNNNVTINNNMLKNYYTGQTKKNNYGYKKIITQPTTVIYEKETLDFSIHLKVNKSVVMDANKFILKVI